MLEKENATKKPNKQKTGNRKTGPWQKGIATVYIDHPLISFVFNIWCQKGRLYNESLGHATLCGTATMVEVLWVGSLIEKDWNNSKDYWSHIRQTDSTDHSAKRTSNKSEQGKSKVQGPDMASVLGHPALLVVPVSIWGSRRCCPWHRVLLLSNEQSVVEQHQNTEKYWRCL